MNVNGNPRLRRAFGFSVLCKEMNRSGSGMDWVSHCCPDGPVIRGMTFRLKQTNKIAANVIRAFQMALEDDDTFRCRSSLTVESLPADTEIGFDSISNRLTLQISRCTIWLALPAIIPGTACGCQWGGWDAVGYKETARESPACCRADDFPSGLDCPR